jgi:hypothetical protein
MLYINEHSVDAGHLVKHRCFIADHQLYGHDGAYLSRKDATPERVGDRVGIVLRDHGCGCDVNLYIGFELSR